MCEISDNLVFLSCLRNMFHYADDQFIDWLQENEDFFCDTLHKELEKSH